MSEEVRDAPRTIPRAIIIALSITITVYAIVAVSLLGTLGADGVAASSAPVRDAVVAAGRPSSGPVITVGAALASLGAVLALIAGIGRTTLAMSREGDLPRWLAAVHPRFHVPHRAEVVLALVVIALRGAIGFSSFGVLLYYFVANVSAFTQRPERQKYPRWVFVIGGFGCLLLVVTLAGGVHRGRTRGRGRRIAIPARRGQQARTAQLVKRGAGCAAGSGWRTAIVK